MARSCYDEAMYRRGYPKRTVGFTIVELLIVIVVIAILAAIVIVAYQGMQQRADNSRIMEGVRFYQKALMAYATDHQSWPTGGTVCLGDGYPANKCWNGPNGTIFVDGPTDVNLAPYVGGAKPIISTKVLQITSSPDYRLGALFNASQNKLIYYLEGAGQTCLDGWAGATEMQGTQCAIVLALP